MFDFNFILKSFKHFSIYSKNGLPSDDNPYLFNGDFVDRGDNSIEVSLILFCGFLMSPSAVFINRGNHEDYVLNIRYGFLKEIGEKFGVIISLTLRCLSFF
jgi:serine/threonine-protein phosphatase with EF-hands